MKNDLFLLIALCFLMVGLLPAQENRPNALSLGWGMGNLKRQDLTFSPMIHESWSPLNIMVEYSRSGKMEQTLFVRFGQYKAMVGEPYDFVSFYNGENTTYPHSFILVDISYALGKKVIEKDVWNLALGGRSRNRLMPSTYTFADFSSFGYYFSFGLDLWLQIQVNPGERHHFSSHLALPILSYNARSDYLWQTDEYIWDNYSHNAFQAFVNYLKDGAFQSWGKSQSVDFDVQYFYTLSEKWEIGGRYALSMNFNQDPTRFSQIEQVFYFSGKLKF